MRIIRPENVKHERKKLYRMAEKVKKGEMTREKFNDCYGAWKAHAQQGNSFLLLQRMDAYVKSLFQGGDTKNGTCEKVGDNSGTAP